MIVQTAPVPSELPLGNDCDDSTVFASGDTFAMAVRELANDVISESVVHVVHGNASLPSVR